MGLKLIWLFATPGSTGHDLTRFYNLNKISKQCLKGLNLNRQKVKNAYLEISKQENLSTNNIIEHGNTDKTEAVDLYNPIAQSLP